MPIGSKVCDLCGPYASGPAAQPWTAPVEAAPVQFASSAGAWVAGPIKPVTAESAHKAGFWMRFLAYLIDAVIITAPAYALGSIILHASLAGREGISLVVQISYFIYFWSAYGKGQTIGMQLLHMKVVRTNGSTLSLSRALIRYVGLIAASLPLSLGLIWAAFDAKKQGWHDKIADTYVVSNW